MNFREKYFPYFKKKLPTESKSGNCLIEGSIESYSEVFDIIFYPCTAVFPKVSRSVTPFRFVWLLYLYRVDMWAFLLIPD